MHQYLPQQAQQRRHGFLTKVRQIAFIALSNTITDIQNKQQSKNSLYDVTFTSSWYSTTQYN